MRSLVYDYVSDITGKLRKSISLGREITLDVQCYVNDGISKLFNVSVTVMRII